MPESTLGVLIKMKSTLRISLPGRVTSATGHCPQLQARQLAQMCWPPQTSARAPPPVALARETAATALWMRPGDRKVASVAAAHEAFLKDLSGLKKDEAGGKAVAEKIETLQLKAMAGRDYYLGRIADLDAALERNAFERQKALDAAAAAAAAAVEE